MALNSFKVARSLSLATQSVAPTSPVNGDMYFDGSAGFQFRQAGAWAPLGDVTLTGSQTLTNKTLTAPDINAGTADSLTSLSVRDTSAAFDVVLAATSSVTLNANRTLTLDMRNAARSIALTGNLDLGGTLTTTSTASITGALSIGGAFTTSANSLTLTTTGSTNVTLPTSGTLVQDTAPTFVTSITSPLVIGGTGAASALALRSTSGTGTTDSILFQTGTNGGTAAGSIASAGAWTLGPASSDALVHTLNGQLANGTVIPSFSSADYRYMGSKFASTLFHRNGTTGAGHHIYAGGYFDGATARYTTANQTAATLNVLTQAALTDPVFTFQTGTSATSAADSAITTRTIGNATAAGLWTLGESGGTQSHVVNGNQISLVSAGNATSVINAAAASESITQYRLNSVLKYTTGVTAGGPGGTDGYVWYNGSAYTGGISSTGTWTLGPTGGGVTHRINTNTTAAGAGTLTVTNAPTTRTTAAVFMTVNINGTSYIIPAFLA